MGKYIVFANSDSDYAEIVSEITVSEVDLEANVPDGCSCMLRPAAMPTLRHPLNRLQVHLPTMTLVEREASEIEHYDAALKNARTHRDMLLLGSDWTQTPDNRLTPEQRAAWAAVREEWRGVVDDLKAGLPARPWAESPA